LIRLGGGTIVEAQQSAESFHALDGAKIRSIVIDVLNQAIADALVIPLPMIVSA
jgi:hypothetical protein